MGVSLGMVIDLTKELWRDVVGYEGLYAVSSFGRIKSLERMTSNGARLLPEKILSQIRQKSGYMRVLLYRDGVRKFVPVHRVVAEAFIENKDNLPCIDHINAIRSDNRVDNLRWVTHKQNTQHMIEMGHYHNNSYAIVGEEAIENCKKRQMKPIIRNDGMKFSSIMEAAEYMGYKNGSPAAISNHLHGLAKSCKGYTFEYAEKK